MRHPPFKKLTSDGRGSNRPEKMGVDFAFVKKGKWYGVQRKEVKDFVKSVDDGRLAREMHQMKALEQAVLVIEGPMKWTLDGVLVIPGFSGSTWTQEKHYKYLLSVRAKGVWVETTGDVTGTAAFLRFFEEWVAKDRHRAFDHRPGPQAKGGWGKPTDADYARHVVCGIDGIGPEKADAMIAHAGRVPFTWMEGYPEAFETIPGFGPKTIAKLKEAI